MAASRCRLIVETGLWQYFRVQMIEFFIMTGPEALIVFAKQPDPRTTKRRLSPPLGREDAARLYACFLEDTLAMARQVHGVSPIVAYDPPAARAYFTALAPDFERMPQAGSDLGERMHQALAALFTQGCRRAILIGSDLPHLAAQTIEQGFQHLRQGVEVVLGPSADGGYYLVGLTRPQPPLFDLPMSTPDVLRQTLAVVERLGLRLALLPENFDVDTAADLAKLQALLQADTSLPARRTRAWLARSRRSDRGLFNPDEL
jgi:rSAM/selenodomain-associated transferase 1